MPDVRMPDGTIIRNVPEGTTKAELERRYKARQEARPDSFWQGVREELGKAAANATWVADAISGRGLAGKITGQPQANDIVRAQVRRQSAQAPVKGSTAGKITGGVLGTLPTAFLGGPVTQGALGGFLLTQDPNDLLGTARDMAIGGIAGKGGGIVGRRVVAPVVRKAAPAARRVAQAITGRAARPAAPVAVQAANPVLDPALEPLGRQAAARAARFQRVGVQNPTTGMVTRDPRAWNFEQEGAKLAGVGDDLLRQLRGVDFDLTQVGRNLVDDAGGAIGAEPTGLRVSKALSARNDALQEGVSGLYRQAREAMGDQPVQSLDNLWTRMADPTLRNNPKIGSMSSSISGLLRDFGVIDDAGANIPGKSLTVGQAEELRKFIGNLGDANDPTARMARKGFQDALDADVLDNVGDDAFQAARRAARARFEEFKNTYPGRLIETGKPEAIGQQVLKGNPSLSDLRALRRSLEAAGPDGEAALQSLRAQNIDDLLAPVTTREGGVSGGQLWKVFEQRQDRLRTILAPDQYKAVRRYAVAARDATAAVPRSNVNYSNTASGLANLFPDAAQAQPNGLASRLGRRAVAVGGGALVGGPLGAGAISTMADLSEAVARSRAEQMAQQALAQQVRLAANPQAAAAAMREAQLAAMREQMLRPYIEGASKAVTAPLVPLALPMVNE